MLFSDRSFDWDEPPDGQRCPAIGPDFDRHLIVGAANTAGLHFENRFDVINRLLEDAYGILAARTLSNNIDRIVKQMLGKTNLPRRTTLLITGVTSGPSNSGSGANSFFLLFFFSL